MGFKIKNGVLQRYMEEARIKDVVIPDTVTSIGYSAFYGCSSLSSIVIPDTVTSIGKMAFYACRSLCRIVIPDSVTSIRNRAFYACSSLVSIMIPDSVTSIEERAFSRCQSLQSIALPNSVTSIGDMAFEGCNSLSSIVIPDSVTSIGAFAFSSCNSLSSIVIPDSVTSIGAFAFISCSSLSSIVIPESVTSIEDYAFSDCSSLRSVVIPDSVTSIGNCAFESCGCLDDIKIPDSVKTLAKNAFNGCDKLVEVNISMKVLKITKDPRIWMGAAVTIPIAELDEVIGQCPEKIFDQVVWLRNAGTYAIDALMAAIRHCPKKIKGYAEILIKRHTGLSAAQYFEKQNRLEEYAAFHHTDADALRDTLLSDFGLDVNGNRSWTLAGKSYTAHLENNLKLTLTDESGKVLKSLPKKGADPEEYEAAKKEFAQLKKEIPAAAKLRNNRLLSDWLEARPRKAEDWKNTYLVNPLLRQLAKLLVWQQKENTFTLNEEGVPVDAAGNPVELTDMDIILAHPMEMRAETTEAWRNYFISHQLSQPFAQVWEPVLDGGTIKPDRYQGATIPLYMLMNKELHGITMEGQSRLKLRDCSAEIKLIEGHHDWVNNQFEITNFRFENYTRAVNHIAVLFDKGTVQGRLLKDDVSAVQWLDNFTLAQITEFINLVTEKGDCPNATAALLAYKQDHYPEATDIAFDEFTLEW